MVTRHTKTAIGMLLNSKILGHIGAMEAKAKP